MQHWTDQAKQIQFVAAPQNIEVPDAGQLVKLEKKLVKPSDILTVRFSYDRKGK
jgi:hypothetical protein